MTPFLKSPLIWCLAPLLLASSASYGREASLIEGQAALNKLMNGNTAYSKAVVSPPKRIAKRRRQVSQQQRPFAVVVACSDSRVSPEIIFNQSLGDLFVVRTAGHLVDDYALGSVEYAVEHLGARLVIVVGHERCGAVDAALKGVQADGYVRKIIKAITPAAKKAKLQPGDPLENAVKENARMVAAQIARSKPPLAHYAGGEPVTVAAAYYNLKTGKIQLVE